MGKQITEKPLTIGPAKAADQLGLAVGTVRQMLNNGALPGIKCGKRWLVPVEALKGWVNENTGRVI